MIRSHFPLLVLSWLAGMLWAHLSIAQEYRTWRHFNSNNGLPQNSVVHMELDTAGYVWIATEGGLVRYDGGALRTFELKGRGALPAKRIRKVIPTALGEIIVEDANGNSYNIHGHIAPVMISSGRQSFQMTGGVPSAEFYTHISRPRQTYIAQPRRRRACFATSDRDMVVIGLDSMWLWHDTSRVHQLPLTKRMDRIFVLQGTAYGTDETGKVYSLDPNTGKADQVQVQGETPPLGTPWPNVFWHQGHPTGHMVVDQRIIALRSDPATKALVAEHVSAGIPPAHTITDILEIPGTRTILVGTSTTGLHVLRAEMLSRTTCEGHVITRSSVFAQALISDGGIIFTADRQAYHISATGCELLEDLNNVDNFILPKDHEGNVWVWRGAEVLRYDPMTKVEEIVLSRVERGVAIKPHGDSVLISVEGAIRVWRSGQLRDLTRVPAKGYQDWPSIITVSPSGAILYGCDRGFFIGSSDHSKFRSVNGLKDMDVRAITQVEDLQLVGTYGNGWYLVQGDSAIRLPNDPLNCLDYAHSFLLRDGILWISTNRGLIHTTMADIRTYLKDTNQRPYLARFGSATGMVNLEFNGGCDPAYITLPDGYLSYPTIEGLVRFSPAAVPDPFPELGLIHGYVRVNGKPWREDDYLIIDHDLEDIEFDFSVPYWGDPENAQFEFLIPGLVDGWRLLPIGERTVKLTRPPPGEYEVFIRKVGSAARGITPETTYWFRIRKPFWATWPAFLVYASVFTGLLWGGAKLNNVRLLRRNRWLEENVATQTEALLHANKELLNAVSHQEKLISVISHDVVPPLRFVARVAHSAELLLREGRPNSDLAETLADLSASTNKLHSNAESLLTWIRTRSKRFGPDIRTVMVRELAEGALYRVHEMLERSGIVAVNEVPQGSMVRTDADLLKIVVHNALMNVHAHAQATEVTITERMTPEAYVLIIADNGRGIPPAVLARLEGELEGISQLDDAERKGPATGLGFVIIAECIRQLGGRIELESDAQGTQVGIHLPHDPTSTV